MEVDPSYCQNRLRVRGICEESRHRGAAYRCMRKMESSSCGRGNLRTGRRRRVSVGGEPLEWEEHQTE